MFSGYFERLPISIQKEIISLTAINTGQEDILLASYLRHQYLTVITNERLYWSISDQAIMSIALEHLAGINISFANSSPEHRPFIDCLIISTKEAEHFPVKMEAGKTCSSMHNVLDLITNLRK